MHYNMAGHYRGYNAPPQSANPQKHTSTFAHFYPQQWFLYHTGLYSFKFKFSAPERRGSGNSGSQRNPGSAVIHSKAPFHRRALAFYATHARSILPMAMAFCLMECLLGKIEFEFEFELELAARSFIMEKKLVVAAATSPPTTKARPSTRITTYHSPDHTH
jgi:hypothetical protein